MKETWKDIKWYEWEYQISNIWNVKNLNYRRIWKERIRKPFIRSWYLQLWLYKKWIESCYLVHKLVAEAFIDNPENKNQIIHINGKKYDNRVENLEWGTASENMIHSRDVLWNTYWPSRVRINRCSLEWEPLEQFRNQSEASMKIWIPQWGISRCCNWKQKTAWWYIWKYA